MHDGDADELAGLPLRRLRIGFFTRRCIRYSHWVVAFVVVMAVVTRGRNLAALGVSWWWAGVLYYLSAAFVGAVAGYLDPAKVTRVHMTILAVVGAVPLMVVLSALLYPRPVPPGLLLLGASVSAVLFGVPFATALYPTYQRVAGEFLEHVMSGRQASTSPGAPT